MEGAHKENIFREAFNKVDGVRRKKAECMRFEKSQAACLGAGLLLQLAVQAALQETEKEEKVRISTELVGDMPAQEDMPSQKRGAAFELAVYTASQVLEQLNELLDLKMYYGGNGKPYLENYPFYFNLSHSGNYVVCAISPREVGVDIQEYRQVDMERLAKRFFSKEEQNALKVCTKGKEQYELFYQLWTRKEAYGKLTGEGIAAVIDKSTLLKEGTFTVAEAEANPQLFWQEWKLDGYAIALCQYGI